MCPDSRDNACEAWRPAPPRISDGSSRAEWLGTRRGKYVSEIRTTIGRSRYCCLFRDKVLNVLLVLIANVVQQVRIQRDDLIQLDGPGFRVCFGIVHGDFDFEIPEIRSPEAFCDSCDICQRIPRSIEPNSILKTCGLDYQGVSFPLASGVSVPGWVRICGQGSCVREDLP